MSIVGKDDSSKQVNSWAQLVGLVKGSVATYCCFTFIGWTGWTLTMP